MQVTVYGGAGEPAANLIYSANDLAYMQATALAATIGQTYQTAIYYNPLGVVISPGYLIVPTQYASNLIDAHGFGAIVDENNGMTSSVVGGGASGGQIVLAGDGGLTYAATGAKAGDNTVVAGGGDNWISFSGSKGSDAAYTSTGNDTIIGGDGHTTIAAGGGDNEIFLFSGTSSVQSSGNDTVSLTGGADTIAVLPNGSDLVEGSQGYAAKLTFIGGLSASTVLAGAGSYTVFGAAGGGMFQGGGAGRNSITGGAGSVTITGGGAGDTLQAGSGLDNVIQAGSGNETLGGGSNGSTLFDLSLHTIVGVGAAIDTILDFTTTDLLQVGGITAIDLALSSYHVLNGNGTFLLGDGSKVVLDGYTQPLNMTDFKH